MRIIRWIGRTIRAIAAPVPPCPDCKRGDMCADCFAAHQW